MMIPPPGSALVFRWIPLTTSILKPLIIVLVDRLDEVLGHLHCLVKLPRSAGAHLELEWIAGEPQPCAGLILDVMHVSARISNDFALQVEARLALPEVQDLSELTIPTFAQLPAPAIFPFFAALALALAFGLCLAFALVQPLDPLAVGARHLGPLIALVPEPLLVFDVNSTQEVFCQPHCTVQVLGGVCSDLHVQWLAGLSSQPQPCPSLVLNVVDIPALLADDCTPQVEAHVMFPQVDPVPEHTAASPTASIPPVVFTPTGEKPPLLRVLTLALALARFPPGRRS
mmetsp:Transcript_94855/g.220157  ORF Transcript_94855/g.220157 Transcript_94855/m.220157 type:complete len:286 (+) Transcript_94855:109-966(+)